MSCIIIIQCQNFKGLVFHTGTGVFKKKMKLLELHDNRGIRTLALSDQMKREPDSGALDHSAILPYFLLQF